MIKKNKINKVFEFLTLIGMVIGITVGTGEFIKNDDEVGSGHILDATHKNVFMALLLWTIIGVSCIFMIIAFAEIASSTEKTKNGTNSSWTKLFIGRKTASFISIFWIFFYLPMLYSLYSMMGIKYLLISFGLDQTNTFNHLTVASGFTYLLGSILLFLFFSLLNSITSRPGKLFQVLGTGFKLLIFLLILIVSFVPALSHVDGNSVISHSNNTWKASWLFMAVGPILFSFDGFILVTNLQGETKHKNHIYSALIIGMFGVFVIYFLEAIALFVGTAHGSVALLFQNAFGPHISISFNLLIVFTIVIGLNGVTYTGTRYVTNDTSAGILTTFNKHLSKNKLTIFQICVGLFWCLLFGLLGLFKSSGVFDPTEYSDLYSNVVTELAFIVYLVILISGLVNRLTNKVKVKKIKYMPIFGIMAAILLSFFTGSALILTITDRSSIKAIITGYMFIFVIVINVILFLINEYFLKKYPNIIQEQEKELINKTKEEKLLKPLNKTLHKNIDNVLEINNEIN